jgi:hypothetical protein
VLRIATKTKLTPEEVIKKAIKFFGPDGYKLKITNTTETTAAFEGGGGSIEIFFHGSGIFRLKNLSE